MFAIFRRLTFWLAAAGLVSLTLFIRDTTAVTPIQPPPSPPPDKPFAQSISTSGIVEALSENTSLGIPFPALIREVKASVSQQVNKDDIILVLDDRDLQSQLTTDLAELDLREADLQRARRKHDRLRQIGQGPALAAADLDSSEDDFLVATAAVAKAKAAIAATRQQLDRYLVRAPISGTILQINVRPGEYSSPGSTTPPVILGLTTSLQIRADVDEQIAPRVTQGAKAVAFRKGDSRNPIPLSFVRIEPFIIPKKNLTGTGSERVDTRVLPVIFSFTPASTHATYVGQQVDVFIEE